MAGPPPLHGERPRVVGVGEVLWDLLPTGPQLGGAPTNFVCHACALGAEGVLISRIGADPRGREALERLVVAGLPRETVAALVPMDSEVPTGTVSVKLEADGQPRYTIHEDVAWDRIEASPAALAAVARADAICFGSLAQRDPRSRRAVQTLAAACPDEALRIFDINLRQSFYSAEVIRTSLELANVLKINDAEWPVLQAQLGLAGDLRSQMEALASRFHLRVIALTRGAEGSLIYSEGEWSDEPARPVSVADTIGAGDSFTAAMTLALLRGWSLGSVNRFAGEVARFVCSQPGATPRLPDSLTRALRSPEEELHP